MCGSTTPARNTRFLFLTESGCLTLYTENMAAGFPVPKPNRSDGSGGNSLFESILERGTPLHRTLTADTVEIIDLEDNYPAVEVVAFDGRVTFTVNGDDPTTSSGHLIPASGALAVQSAGTPTGTGGVTRIKCLGGAGETPLVVVTGLR